MHSIILWRHFLTHATVDSARVRTLLLQPQRCAAALATDGLADTMSRLVQSIYYCNRSTYVGCARGAAAAAAAAFVAFYLQIPDPVPQPHSARRGPSTKTCRQNGKERETGGKPEHAVAPAFSCRKTSTSHADIRRRRRRRNGKTCIYFANLLFRSIYATRPDISRSAVAATTTAAAAAAVT